MNLELEKVIEENSWLIFHFLKKYNNYVDKEDLIQVARIGLINAYSNYDKNRGVKFSSFAYKYISGELKKFVRENRTIKINKDMSKLCNSIKTAKSLLEQKLMKTPTNKELCEFLEIDELTLEMALEIQENTQSLDQPILNDGKSSSLYDIIPEKKNQNIDDLIMLREELSKLDYQDKRLIQYRYFNDKTQSEVAEILGISQAKASRIEKKVLSKLKSSMIA